MLKQHFKLTIVLRLLKIPKSTHTYFDWAPRLRLTLTNLHLYHGTNRIHRLIQEAGIYSVMRRRFNKPTTAVEYKQRPNLIRHLPEANAWRMDIIYLKLRNGQWVYLASVLG